LVNLATAEGPRTCAQHECIGNRLVPDPPDDRGEPHLREVWADVDELRLQVEDLTVQYGAYTAIAGLNLGIPRGQYVVLIGENGAGKSSLLKCVGGWIRPSQGSLRMDGQLFEEHERALRAQVKLVPDTPAFYPELNAWEHVDLVMSAHRRRRDEDLRREARSWFEAFGIDRSREAYPSSFSRGMQYKLAITMSILTRPNVLLLDEPYGPLDPASQSYLASQLTQLAATGVSIIVSTHLLPNEHPPERVIMLDQGSLALDIPLREKWNPESDVPLALIPEQLLRQVLAERRGLPHE